MDNSPETLFSIRKSDGLTLCFFRNGSDNFRPQTDSFGFWTAKRPLKFWSNCDRVRVVHDQNQEVKMAENTQGNLVTTKRGLPVYRVNPSIPPANGLATRQRRFEV